MPHSPNSILKTYFTHCYGNTLASPQKALWLSNPERRRFLEQNHFIITDDHVSSASRRQLRVLCFSRSFETKIFFSFSHQAFHLL